MRLYFYFLEDNGIRTAECEAEEKPKTYKIIGKSPVGFYKSAVNKDEIGVMQKSYSKVIIFAEPNFTGAIRTFWHYVNDNIQALQEKIERYEKQLQAIEESREEI